MRAFGLSNDVSSGLVTTLGWDPWDRTPGRVEVGQGSDGGLNGMCAAKEGAVGRAPRFPGRTLPTLLGVLAFARALAYVCQADAVCQ